MIVNLEKDDLINLIRSQTPQDSDFLAFTNNRLGKWSFYHSRWDWYITSLYKKSEEELLDLYSYLRGMTYMYVKE